MGMAQTFHDLCFAPKNGNYSFGFSELVLLRTLGLLINRFFPAFPKRVLVQLLTWLLFK